jgi:hypothetical protein
MKVQKSQNHWTITVDSKTTIGQFIDYLASHPLIFHRYPYDIRLNEKNKKKQKLFENAFQCYYLVSKYASSDVNTFYPSQVEQSSNLPNTSNLTWNDVPCYQKYINSSFNIISDTEYLLIYFSKLLESFDTNAMALLPSYPKTILNQLLPPHEIQEICFITLLEWQIKGKRGKTIPLSKDKSLQVFKTSFPVLYTLIFEKDGFEVLQCVYDILKLVEKDEKQSLVTRKKCVSMYQKLLKKISNPRLLQFIKNQNKVGVFFVGMSNPRFNPLCLLSMYLLFHFYYLPKENIYSLADSVLSYIERVKKEYYRMYPTNIFQYDVDTYNRIQKKQVVPDYFLKKNVDTINKLFGKSNYTKFFDTLSDTILCNTKQSEILI